MSTETDDAALPFSILKPHSPPERTSEPAMGDMHNIDPFFPPLGTPARLNAEASLARSPPDCIDGTPSNALPSGAEAERPQRVLRDALVAASCRSNPGGELVPPMMSPLHQSRRSPELADTEPLEHDDDDDNTEHTMVELARFITELTDARAQNDFLQARVADLTRQLADNAVGAAYVCHNCPILRDDLCKYQQSLDEAADLLLHEKTLRSERELELERLRSYCRQVEREHDETKQMLVASQSKAAARPVPRYAPPVVPGSPSSAHPPFNLFLPPTTAPASAVPVRPSAVSPFPHHLAPSTGGQASAVYLSARELNATIAAAPVALEVASVAIAIEITMNATFVNTVFVAITTTLSVPMLELLLPMLCLCILATSALVANRKAVIGPSTARSCRKIFCINGFAINLRTKSKPWRASLPKDARRATANRMWLPSVAWSMALSSDFSRK